MIGFLPRSDFRESGQARYENRLHQRLYGQAMQNIRVLAFTDDFGRLALLKNGSMLAGKPVKVISSGILHAITTPEPILWPWENNEYTRAMRLIAHNRQLGALTTLGKVIPASFDSVFEHPASIQRALSQHQGDILDLLSRYGSARQFSLLVRWDTSTMQMLMQRHAGSAEPSIEGERRIIRDQILMQTQRLLKDIIILENNESDVVLQAIVLVDAAMEEKLVGVLQQIDKECCGRLDMRLVGPLPACNFARIEIKLPDVQSVRKACRELGVSKLAKLSDVKTAYRSRIKNLHPDSRMETGKNDVMVRLTHSYRTLTRLAAQQNSNTEINPERQWIRCDRKTLRETPLLSIQRGVSRYDDAYLRRN